jgi:chemotaxis signal transduction protein
VKTSPRSTAEPGSREGMVIFVVAGHKFLIAASAVKEIRGAEGLSPFTMAGVLRRLEKLQYTFERHGTTYFVVDAGIHFGLGAASRSRLLVLRNAPIAILADSTDRMVEISAIHALPDAFSHEEREWYRGLAVLNDELAPVVNSDAFLSKLEQEVLRDELERLRGAAAL